MDLINNLNGPRALEDNRPSIYELVAKDQMDELLDGAFLQVVQYSTQYTSTVYRYRNSIYFLVRLFLSSESISEQFYGLKRSRKSKLNLVEWCFYPTLIQVLQNRQPTLVQKIQRLQTIFGLVFKVGYMFGKLKYSPWLYLSNQDIVRKTAADFNVKRTWNQKIFHSVTVILPFLLMFYRFLEFYQTIPKEKKPIPPPPELGREMLTPGQCYICKKAFVNEAAANHYVYCYACIYQYISTNGKCPISDIELKVDDIMKIYDNL